MLTNIHDFVRNKLLLTITVKNFFRIFQDILNVRSSKFFPGHYEIKIVKTFKNTNKENPYPPGNGFSRALESRFLVPKNEAQCSHFHPMGPFS